MRFNKLTGITLLSMVLASCQSLTTPTISTVDGVPTPASNATGVAAPRYVLCSEDPVIPYRAPKPGQQEDRANAFDTPETIGADAPSSPARGTIRYHNAIVESACGIK